MNFKVTRLTTLSTATTDYNLKDEDGNEWIFRLTKTTNGGLREFVKYPKHWKGLMLSNSLANLTRKSHMYDLAMKAIEKWKVLQGLTDDAKKTWEDILD